jgi:hypothetical protein
MENFLGNHGTLVALCDATLHDAVLPELAFELAPGL